MRSASRTTLSAFLAAALASSAAADVLTLNLTPPGGVYGPGEQVTMTLTGTPGSLAPIGFDTDPGPTLVPPYGTFQLGFSSSFRLLEPPSVLPTSRGS